MPLTINFWSIDFTIEHEVWFVKNFLHEIPIEVVVGVSDRLSYDPKRHQHQQQYDDEFQQISHLNEENNQQQQMHNDWMLRYSKHSAVVGTILTYSFIYQQSTSLKKLPID